MLLAPTASAAVVKPAVPLLSAAVSSTLPLLTSVKVTEPDAVPLLALTCAVKVTQESWATDVAEAVSVVLGGHRRLRHCRGTRRPPQDRGRRARNQKTRRNYPGPAHTRHPPQKMEPTML